MSQKKNNGRIYGFSALSKFFRIQSYEFIQKSEQAYPKGQQEKGENLSKVKISFFLFSHYFSKQLYGKHYQKNRNIRKN